MPAGAGGASAFSPALIPPVVSVKPGDVFRADCREWFDGATENDDSADDVRYALLPGVHALTGPFRVEGGVLTYKVIWDFTGGVATSRPIPDPRRPTSRWRRGPSARRITFCGAIEMGGFMDTCTST